MIKLDPCQTVYRLSICLLPNNGIKREQMYGISGIETKAKNIYFNFKSSKPAGLLYDAVEDNKLMPCDPYTRIFIAPESKISRDVLRNGGYSITYKREAAQYIIVPAVGNYTTFSCNALYRKDDDSCVLIDIQIPKQKGRTTFDSDEVQAILNYLQGTMAYASEHLYYAEDFSRFGVSFVPKCEDYEDILLERYTEREYIDETNVIYNTSTDICPETLLVWSKLDDDRLLEKAIVASNWEEYPVTLGLFLRDTINLSTYSFGWQGRVVLEAIDYASIWYDNEKNRTVTAKDWNMYQSFLMAKYGAPPEGGFVSGRIEDGDSKFLRSRRAIKPILATEDKTIEDYILEAKK